jgi:hypothetical protein
MGCLFQLFDLLLVLFDQEVRVDFDIQTNLALHFHHASRKRQGRNSLVQLRGLAPNVGDHHCHAVAP